MSICMFYDEMRHFRGFISPIHTAWLPLDDILVPSTCTALVEEKRAKLSRRKASTERKRVCSERHD